MNEIDILIIFHFPLFVLFCFSQNGTPCCWQTKDGSDSDSDIYLRMMAIRLNRSTFEHMQFTYRVNEKKSLYRQHNTESVDQFHVFAVYYFANLYSIIKLCSGLTHFLEDCRAGFQRIAIAMKIPFVLRYRAIPGTVSGRRIEWPRSRRM